MDNSVAVPDTAPGFSEQYRALLTRLLAQDVVCQWSQPALARLLEKEEVRQRINRWVGELGMELACTSSERGHYLVYRGYDVAVKSAAREMFTKVMKDLRFYVRMLEMMMNALHADAALVPGEELRFNDLLSLIGQSPSLQSQLGELHSSRKHSAVKDQMETLFARMVKEGLLVEANAKHSIYQVTGRIELIQDVIIFIQDNERLPEAEVDTPSHRQGTLA